jgi:predicted AlkP superfamily pyrophosphatase or phosphodiesterase
MNILNAQCTEKPQYADHTGGVEHPSASDQSEYAGGVSCPSELQFKIPSGLMAICLPVFIGVLSWLLIPQAQADNVGSRHKAIFMILDGIPTDVIERVATPNLDAIAAIGGYHRAEVGGPIGGPAETPTVSAPGYMSLVTGTWANKHNVYDNTQLAPNYDYWNLFRLAKAAEPPLKTGIFSTWTDNRTVLLGAGMASAGNLTIDFVADGFETDATGFPHEADDRQIQSIDRHVAEEAARTVTLEGPDLSWVYLQYTDDVAHAHGDSAAFDTAVEVMDQLVGTVWTAVQTRAAAQDEDWLILVTTDHGRDSETGRDHGGQSDRERITWITTNSERLNSRFHGQPTIVDIFPSIASHLGIPIPLPVAESLDGRSFID